MRQPADLQALLGHAFHDRSNLQRALTHSSLAYERAAGREDSIADAASTVRAKRQDKDEQDNEQLEFLGDAVLGLVVAEGLFRAFPELREGDLTRMRAHLVSRKHLGQVAARLSLGSYLRLGRGEERSGGRQKAVLLANAIEAVIAALYLDGGMAAAASFVQGSIVQPYVDDLRAGLDAGDAMGDHKSALQEWLQANKSGSPRYLVKAESGPDHRKRFLVQVEIVTADGELMVARGNGTTKKKAEQEAARKAYEALRKTKSSDSEEAAPAQDSAKTTRAEGRAAKADGKRRARVNAS